MGLWLFLLPLGICEDKMRRKICHKKKKKKRAEISDLGEGNVEFQQSKVWISALMLTDVKIIGMEVVNCTWEVVSRASIKHTDASLW